MEQPQASIVAGLKREAVFVLHVSHYAFGLIYGERLRLKAERLFLSGLRLLLITNNRKYKNKLAFGL